MLRLNWKSRDIRTGVGTWHTVTLIHCVACRYGVTVVPLMPNVVVSRSELVEIVSIFVAPTGESVN